MQISALLRIGRGVSAVAGSGGKTTLLDTLAEELCVKGSVVLCTSTHIRVPELRPLVTGGAEELSAALKRHRTVCVGTPAAEPGKLTAPVVPFEELARLADYVLVEADGARGLPLKAHAPHEPVIPSCAQRVVLVLGADGFGKPVRAVCHRSAQWAELSGVSEDDAAAPEQAARVILAEGIGDRVFCNKVETAADYAAAERLTKLLRCPVAAGSLHKGVYTCLR